MKITGARVALDADRAERRDLFVSGCGADIDLAGHLVLPGLINAHDHLDLDLFPRLVHRIYSNATEWAEDIYRPGESPVKEHLAIAKTTRLIWGGIRNLLSGVTTAAHHNPYDPVFDRNFPVRVVRDFGWAHSLVFSPDILERFRRTPEHWPFIVHAAEGTDESARDEITRLDEMELLTPRTVLVHALAADPEILKARGCAIVWCPQSNFATSGATLSLETLRSGIPIALGTDSALTARGDLADEIRVAHYECGLTLREIYSMVTDAAARILRLQQTGDWIAVKDEGQSPCEALLRLQPEMVMVDGRIRLSRLPYAALHPIRHETRGTVFIDADVSELHAQVVAATGADCRLAGMAVSP